MELKAGEVYTNKSGEQRLVTDAWRNIVEYKQPSNRSKSGWTNKIFLELRESFIKWLGE